MPSLCVSQAGGLAALPAGESVVVVDAGGEGALVRTVAAGDFGEGSVLVGRHDLI